VGRWGDGEMGGWGAEGAEEAGEDWGDKKELNISILNS